MTRKASSCKAHCEEIAIFNSKENMPPLGELEGLYQLRRLGYKQSTQGLQASIRSKIHRLHFPLDILQRHIQHTTDIERSDDLHTSRMALHPIRYSIFLSRSPRELPNASARLPTSSADSSSVPAIGCPSDRSLACSIGFSLDACSNLKHF